MSLKLILKAIIRTLAEFLEMPRLLKSQNYSFKSLLISNLKELAARTKADEFEFLGHFGELNFDIEKMESGYFGSFEIAKGVLPTNAVRIFGSHITCSIGHTSHQIALRVRAAQVENESNQSFLILIGRSQNRVYARYWGKYFPVLETDQSIVNQIEKYAWRYLEPAWIYPSVQNESLELNLWREKFDFYTREKFRIHGISPELNLHDNELVNGYNFLRSKGCDLAKGDYFVTIHVRSQAAYYRGSDRSKEYARNANIDTYLPAIRWITENGGFVVRVGSYGVNRLPPLPRVIDYAATENQSESLNTFFLGACKYMIGTTSGPIGVPSTFGIPTLQTNATMGRNPWFPNSLMIPKLARHQSGEILTLDEMVESGVAWRDHFASSDGKILWRDNTEDEILAAVKDIHGGENGTLSWDQRAYVDRIREFGSDSTGDIAPSFLHAHRHGLLGK